MVSGLLLFVLVEDLHPLVAVNLDRRNLFLELPGRLRCRKTLLRTQCPAILLFAGDLVRFCQIFRVPP